MFMARLEERPLEGSEETFRVLSGLLALLQAFRADMAPAFRADALAFFGGTLAQLHDLRWAPQSTPRKGAPCSTWDTASRPHSAPLKATSL